MIHSSGPDHLQSGITEETLDRIDIRNIDSAHHLHRMVDRRPEHLGGGLLGLGDIRLESKPSSHALPSHRPGSAASRSRQRNRPP